MFDLKAITEKVLAQSTGVRQTHDLADQVLAAIPDDGLRAALRETLPMYLRNRMALARNLSSTVTDNPYLDTKPRKAGQRNSGRSSAMRAIREWWLDKVEVHVAGGGYLKIGECTFDDLMFAAEERRTIALNMVNGAERFETVAKALKDAGVNTVQELPAKVRTELTPLFERG